MFRISKLLIFIAIIFIPILARAEDRCISTDATYYENCMIENISNMVSEKKYNYAIDLLNTYEEWFRAQNKNDNKSIARIFSSKAAIYYMKGEYEQSLELFKEAEKIYNSNADRLKSAEMKTNISVVLASMNNYKEALNIANEAEGFYRSGKHNVDLADLLFNKGIFYFFLNDYNKAIDSLSEAEKIYLKANLKIRYLSTQVLKGIIKAKLGEYKEALYLCENNILSFSLKHYCIALANDGLGKKEEAKKAYQKAIERIDKNVSKTLKGSGDVAAQAISEKYAPVFTDYLLFMLKNSIK